MASSYIYNKLKTQFDLKSYSNFLDIKSIETPVELDFNEFNSVTIYPGFRYAMIPSKLNKYIIFVGKKDLNLGRLQDFLIPVYNNQIELYDEDNLIMNFKDLDKIFEKLNVNLQLETNTALEEYEPSFTDLHQYFEPIIILEVNNNLNFTVDLFYQIIVGVLLENQKFIILDFSNDLFKKLNLLNESNNINFYYKFLYRSVISSTWEEVFLQFYRMIERVFPIFHYYEIYSRYEIKENSLPINVIDFSKHVEEVFKIRPEEKTIVKQIIKNYSKSNDYQFFNLICNSKKSSDQIIDETDISAAGTHFYTVRNVLTHAREIFINPSDDKNKHALSLIKDDKCFKSLIECTLKIVHYTYLEITSYLSRQK